MSTRWMAAVALAAAAVTGMDARAQGRDLSNRDLSKSDFAGKDLAGANLSGTTLFLTSFKKANLQGANLRDADLTSASLDGADLTGADLRGATVLRASFQEAVLVNAILEGISFTSASLFRVKARGAVLRGAKDLADLRQADLRGADLRGANLSASAGYGLGETQLAGATYDDATRWPAAFDPATAGLVKGASPAAKDPDPRGAGSAIGAGSGAGRPAMGAGSGSSAAPADDELARPGREVMAKYGANWLRAKVEKVEGDRVLVSWDGYDARENSWVPRDHLKARVDPLAPSGQAAQAAGFYQPGKEVEVKYGAGWLRGKIEQVDGNRVLVSWDGYDKSQNSWVPKENVRARGAADTPASPSKIVPPGKGGLDGVHLWAMVTPQTGTRIIRYLLKPDGTFVSGRAFTDGEGVDVAKAGAKFPSEAGTYATDGTTLTFAFADGRTATKELVASDRGPRIRGWQRGIAFPDGHRLAAKYDVQGGVAIAGATGDQSQVWSFNADGTFAVVEGRVANAGPGATHAHTAEELKWKGSYSIKSHTLSMTFDGGGTKNYTIFLSGEEISAAPRMLFVDMGVFKKQE